MADNHYDVIIIGTGAGGGTLAYRLAPSGKRILLLERGGYVPREKQNWDSRAVEVENRYHSSTPTSRRASRSPAWRIRTAPCASGATRRPRPSTSAARPTRSTTSTSSTRASSPRAVP